MQKNSIGSALIKKKLKNIKETLVAREETSFKTIDMNFFVCEKKIHCI